MKSTPQSRQRRVWSTDTRLVPPVGALIGARVGDTWPVQYTVQGWRQPGRAPHALGLWPFGPLLSAADRIPDDPGQEQVAAAQGGWMAAGGAEDHPCHGRIAGCS